MIEKPTSLSVNDYLIRRLSVKLLVDETTIRKIVDFQGKNANKATHTNNEIEFSGFGKFIFHSKRAEKVLVKAEAKLANLKLIENPNEKLLNQIRILETEINYIKSKR